MPVYVYVIVNAVLALLVVGGIAGLQLWSILTQHRDSGCEDVRLRLPRLRISVSVSRPQPAAAPLRPEQA